MYGAARAQGLSHIQADILCRRNISDTDSLTPLYDPKLREIPAPQLLKNCTMAVGRIVTAIKKGENIGLLTDYDVDGLTANAVAQKAFADYFQVDDSLIHSFVGNRLQDGYGLTDQLCQRILANTPCISLLITADCGVSDEKRLARLKEAGIDVVVTDHHLVPGDEFPHSAYTVVNPQQPECPYPDKAISGCMVCWLVLSAVRTRLVEDGIVPVATPTLISLLDYVALSTIADSVSLLSPTNRAVVRYGLLEINRLVRHCWQVMEFGSRPVTRLTEEDLAFQVGPRINGAGRMADPQLALDFLLSSSEGSAGQLFAGLTGANTLRKKIQDQAMDLAHGLMDRAEPGSGIVLYHPDFHPGILGIIASKLAESYGVPAVVFAGTPVEGILAGSCRTNGTVHIRKMLDRAAEMEIGASSKSIISFGGHRGAAGIKLHEQGLEVFRENFLAAISSGEVEGEGVTVLETDGGLTAEEISHATLDEINHLAPFGQHFEHPVFLNEFTVESAKFVGKDKDHLQFILRINKTQYRGIWFRASAKNKKAAEAAVSGKQIHCLYQLASNEFRGKRSLQLCITDVREG